MLRRILIAPNAFKGTLTAADAAAAMARGLRRALGAGVALMECPVADGGDGFAEVLLGAMHGKWLKRCVRDAVGREHWAPFGISGGHRQTAVIELARASGLALLKHRSPMRASTYGTGELIRAALDMGVRRILLGIGGSASTDGGTGLARALGVRFLDGRGREVAGGGAGLNHIEHIDISQLDKRLATGRRVKLDVACDVVSPLFGMKGAAQVFGPQKGATAEQVRVLDAGLRKLARVIERDLGVNVNRLAGGGAAGGTGAGVVAFLGARLRPGFELVAEEIGLRSAMRRVDLAVTGEGCLDAGSAHGKAPAEVLRMGRELGVPVAAIAGHLGPGAEELGFARVVASSQASVPATRGAAMSGLVRSAEKIGQWILESHS